MLQVARWIVEAGVVLVVLGMLREATVLAFGATSQPSRSLPPYLVIAVVILGPLLAALTATTR